MSVSRTQKNAKALPLVASGYHALRMICRYVDFIGDFVRFRRLAQQITGRFPPEWRNRYPCLRDKTAITGFDRHYIYHPAWAMRILTRTRPDLHVDIASSLSFVSMASAIVPVQFYDYRPADLVLSNLECRRGDLLALPFPDNSILSLSCMHVVEHIGLGRYSDPLDPNGDLKAMRELKRVLAPGGSLLFVVPVGKSTIMFNAHRIYSFDQICDYFSELEVKEFTLIPELAEDGPPVRDASRERTNQEKYGCGCFWLVKQT